MLIEGIGNEVLYALGAFFGTFVPMMIMIFRGGQQNRTIHPDSQENVEATRERVVHERAEHHQHTNQSEHRQPNQPPMRENDSVIDCPVCLAPAEFAIQTNCGHLFCGVCILTYWRSGHWLGAIKCPLCRQTVTLMLIHFTQDEYNTESPEKHEIISSINQYNRRFSGEPRTWREYVQDLPTLLRHAFSEIFSASGLVLVFRLRIIIIFLFAILYFLSPLDIIPEAMFGIFGFLDDLFIVFLLAIYVSIIYRNVVRERAAAQELN